jgi:hypothetical protein
MYSRDLVSGRDHAGRVASALFIGCFALFLWSPIRHLSDAKYSLLLSESLLRLNGPSLEAFLPQFGEAEPTTPLPYQLRRIGAHVHYLFPPGTSMLTVPLLAALRLFGVSVVAPNGTFSEDSEELAHGLLAALLGAGTSMLFFLIAKEFVDWRVAVGVALAGALGSPVWSTASRVLWSHTWSLFLLSLVLLILVKSEMGAARPLSAIGLACILVTMFVVRPTNAIACFLISVYCVGRGLVKPIPFLACLVPLLAGFSAYSYVYLGGPVPSYFQPGRLSLATVWQGLTGNLFSPSRGLFVYVPILPVVVWSAVYYRRRLTQPRLAALPVFGIAGEVLPPALFPHWYGGYSFGARLTMGAVPWAVALAAITVRAGSPWPRPAIVGARAWSDSRCGYTHAARFRLTLRHGTSSLHRSSDSSTGYGIGDIRPSSRASFDLPMTSRNHTRWETSYCSDPPSPKGFWVRVGVGLNRLSAGLRVIVPTSASLSRALRWEFSGCRCTPVLRP